MEAQPDPSLQLRRKQILRNEQGYMYTLNMNKVTPPTPLYPSYDRAYANGNQLQPKGPEACPTETIIP
jgi:hypothetical protein